MGRASPVNVQGVVVEIICMVSLDATVIIDSELDVKKKTLLEMVGRI